MGHNRGRRGHKELDREAIEEVVAKGSAEEYQSLRELVNHQSPCELCGGDGVYDGWKKEPKKRPLGQKYEPRVCGRCKGTGKVLLDAKTVADKKLELIKFGMGQKKAVEMSGPQGKAIPTSITVEFVEPKQFEDAENT